MNVRRMLRGGALAFVVSLAGCGGGGGGTASTGAPATLAGTVTYDAVPNVNGALAYNATASKPVRGAGVDIVDAQSGAVLASTATDASGHYSTSVAAFGPVMVRVRAQLSQTGAGPSWDVTVRDNTQGNALYSMESPSFTVTANGATRDLHAPSGWGGTSYTGERTAGPFAILDTIYTAMGKVLSVAPNASFPTLRVFWSTRNTPSDGQVSLGQIGTTSFNADPVAGDTIYVLGRENVDTDEYDASVIAHEWGHYYQHTFSRDDSPGGSHDFEDLLDQRLAFSEGWGNAWSGIALGRQDYGDSMGPSQGPGVFEDLSAGADAPQGWYREVSVQAVLWRLNNQFGFAGIHQAMAGGLRTTPTVTTIHAFAAAFAGAMPSAQNGLASLLVWQSISGALNDPWATLETNSDGDPSLLPLYRSASVGQPTTACVTNRFGNDNKLGSFVYLRVQIPAARNYQVVVNGPAGSDPDFSVYAGGRLASSQGLGTSEAGSFGLPAGDVVLVVNDANNSSSNTCFNISIN